MIAADIRLKIALKKAKLARGAGLHLADQGCGQMVLYAAPTLAASTATRSDSA